MLARLGKPITLPPPPWTLLKQDAQDTKLERTRGLTRMLQTDFSIFAATRDVFTFNIYNHIYMAIYIYLYIDIYIYI